MSALLAAWAWAKEHKLFTGVVALCVACFVAGRASVRQEPAVHEVVDEHKAAASSSASDTTRRDGPKKTVTLNFDPAPAAPAHKVAIPDLVDPVDVPRGERIESVTIEEDAPSTTETKAATESVATEDRHLELTITPPVNKPGWALQLGFEDVLHARSLRLAARRRLFGPVWLELSAVPVSRSLGVAAAVEW